MNTFFSAKNKKAAAPIVMLLLLTVAALCLPGSILAQTFNVGALPPGKTIIITYKVSANDPLTPLGDCNLSNQSNVTGSNIAGSPVQTNDPANVAPDPSPTLTPMSVAPAITACANITTSTDIGICGALESFAATATGCPAPTLVYKIGATTITSPHTFPLGTTTVDVTATNDNPSSPAACSFTVTVNDNTVPTIACPDDQTVAADVNCTGMVGPWSALSVSDNCTAMGSITVTQSPASSTVLSGHNDFETVTLTADDGNGNQNSCMFTVTLKDQTVPTISNCPNNQNVLRDAACVATLPNYTGVPTTGDNCPGSVTVTQMPAPGTILNGTVTVTLTATDMAGYTATCSFDATPIDQTPPSISCPANQNVLNTNDSPCSATVNGIDPVSATDNCGTPTLTYALNGATAGSGSGSASGQIFLAGVTTVTYTVTDGANLTSSCMFTVTVSSCIIDISGTIIWENDDVSGVGSVNVALTGDATGSVTTPAAGTYAFNGLMGSDFTITPTKTINKLNGVTVADATAIQQHVANITPITDPYKQVAADVNKSNSISLADATIINQSVLGNPAALTQFKTSWRFTPTTPALSIPPWGFAEKIVITGANGNLTNQNFFGIKTGDIVTSFANPANFGAGEPLVFNLKDQVLEAGAEVTAEFSANQLNDLVAYQFALRFDPVQLQFLEVQPLDALPLVADNFGLFNIAEGEIRSVWSQAEGTFVEEAASVFRLKFTALQGGGKLSEALYLDEDIILARTYNSALAESAVQLNYFETTGTTPVTGSGGLRLLQNVPNPFSDATTIPFVLPQECEATIRVFNVNGHLLQERSASYPAGKNTMEFEFEKQSANGVLYYELTTPFGVLARKMVAVDR